MSGSGGMRVQGPDAVRAILGNVSRETISALEHYAARLTEWNQRINMVSPADLQQLWGRHIADCAQLISLAPPGSNWLDIGSGAGLPGMIIGLLLKEYGGGHVHLVESNRKKASFLLYMTAESGAPVTVHARRIEDLHGADLKIDVVTARAVAPLPRLLRMAKPWLEQGATGLFQKGRDYPAELEQSRDECNFTLVEHRSSTDSDAVILELSRVEYRQ